MWGDDSEGDSESRTDEDGFEAASDGGVTDGESTGELSVTQAPKRERSGLREASRIFRDYIDLLVGGDDSLSEVPGTGVDRLPMDDPIRDHPTRIDVIADVVDFSDVTNDLPIETPDPDDLREEWFDFSYLRAHEEVERYWVNEPYAYVSVLRSDADGELHYRVTEPALGAFEEYILEELTLLFSVPLAAAYLGIAAVVFGTPSADGILSTPFRTTSLFLVAPFLVVATPMSIVHEQSRRQRRHVASRLPDALDILASSNQMGVSLVEGFGLVARNVTGRFAEELRHVRNDIRWNHDMRSALLSMADRMAVPQLTRTCKILAEGSRSTGNLHQVLKIAAQDTRHRLQMERAREQELQTYVAVVAIGFLVYLGTVVVIDQSFLAPVIERIGETESGELDQLINVGAGDVSTYNALFLHSALVQAVGTGLIIGELADSDVRSGLKYSIALVLVALAVFAFV